MDNLSSLKKPAVRAVFRSVGARLLLLPPYSSDLNQIEQVFAKLKHLLRKAAERTHETILATHQQLARHLPTTRMRQLPQKLRISVKLTSSSH